MMMDKPYKMASPIALCRLCCFFRKKLTVRGIMGQTQGVSNANNPPINPDMKINQRELSCNNFSVLIARSSSTTGCQPF